MLIYILLVLGLCIRMGTWIITDPRSFKERTHHFSGFAGWVTVLLLLGNLALQLLGHNYFRFSVGIFEYYIVFVGMVGFFGGLILALWAKLTMKRMWGAPAQHTIARQNKLVIGGPFRFTRNPIYVGLLMMQLGFAFSLKSMLFFAVYILYMHFRKAILKEETLLEKHFGKQYKEYKKKVPRFV